VSINGADGEASPLRVLRPFYGLRTLNLTLTTPESARYSSQVLSSTLSE